MANLLRKGAAMLNRTLGTGASDCVVYQRGLVQADWHASIGATEFQSEDEGEVNNSWTSRDYIGDAAELVAGGITMPPLAGDQVIEVIRGQTVTHELMLMPGTQPFRFCDPGECRVRVHTKEVSRV